MWLACIFFSLALIISYYTMIKQQQYIDHLHNIIKDQAKKNSTLEHRIKQFLKGK